MAGVARMTKPYRAVVEKNWKALESYFMEHNEALTSQLTVSKDTVFHIAVYIGNAELLKKLLDVEAMSELNEMKNEYGNTPLHVAAAAGNVKIARLLIKKDKKLPETKNSRGETPLFTAAAFGWLDMVEYLADRVPDWTNHRRRDDSVSILHVAVIGKHFETALQLAKSDQSLIGSRDNNGMTCLQLLANMPDAFKSGISMNILQKLIYLCLPDDDHETQDTSSQRQDLEGGCYFNGCTAISRIYYTVIWRCIARAAKNGIVEIVEVVLKLYPQAIEHVNAQDGSIFHVAARYRRKEIFDLLQHSNVPRSRLTRRLNRVTGDSILHQAAYFSKRQLRDRPGEALLMQSEIQWFKRVRNMVPPYFINHRNNNNQTAEEMFINKHKELMKDGRKWIDQTIKGVTVIAVLIATVAFTCAYTIPGGFNPKTGQLLLLKATSFRVFTISDTLSLCFSLTSVVVFLSIRTSGMDEQEFIRSFPLKLVFGLTTLFFSVVALMVAFSDTLDLMARPQTQHWDAIPIYTIIIFLTLQFALYVINIAWFAVRDLLQSFRLESLRLRPRMIQSSV